MIFGIMGAMPDEVDQLCAKLENVTVEPYGGVEYHKGTLAGKQVVVCCAGMGKANAAATTQVLITKFGAEKIIFSGIAGNMTSKIGIGDVVIGKTVLYHDAQLDMICQNPPFRGDGGRGGKPDRCQERRALRHPARHERQRRRGRPRGTGGEEVQHQRICRHRH